MEKLQKQLEVTRQLQTPLVQSRTTQVGRTDPECRPQRKVGLGYNAQIAVDAKHHLIVATDIVEAGNDQHQLVPMAEQARVGLGQHPQQKLRVVADVGYYDRVTVAATAAANLEIYVPKPKKGRGQNKDRFHKSAFIYQASTDTYLCPEGASLKRETQTHKRGLRVFFYAQPQACRQCPLRAKCTTIAYRRIERWEHETLEEQIEKRLRKAPQIMRKRGSVVEHPFGTIKFWNHQSALLTRGLR